MGLYSLHTYYTIYKHNMSDTKPQFLLIDKPPGWTSFDVVGFVRKQARQKDPTNKKIKVGHAGTLDPFATGLLIVGVGREATKRLDEFKGMPKTYIATIQFGATSDTYDIDGVITPFTPAVIPTEVEGSLKAQTSSDFSIPLRFSRNDIEKVLKNFTGKQNQIPPMYSAKKINGKKLYELARAGITIERQPSEIEIYDIKLLEYTWPVLKIEVHCSTGTYIRSLAHDIGQKLGVGAYCSTLIRTAIGDYKLENALSPDKIDLQNHLCHT